MEKSITFFVCGTPSNKKGFEYKTFDDSKLPGVPSSYLDVFDTKLMSNGKTYKIQTINPGGKTYSLIVVYLRINPSDQLSSRGAFIGVGAISADDITINESICCFQIISEIHGNLAGLRNKNNAFDQMFQLGNYAYTSINLNLPIMYLIDALGQKSSKVTHFPKKNDIVFNEIHDAHMSIPDKFHYLAFDNANQIKQQEFHIAQLKDDLSKREKIIDRLQHLIKIQQIAPTNLRSTHEEASKIQQNTSTLHSPIRTLHKKKLKMWNLFSRKRKKVRKIQRPNRRSFPLIKIVFYVIFLIIIVALIAAIIVYFKDNANNVEESITDNANTHAISDSDQVMLDLQSPNETNSGPMNKDLHDKSDIMQERSRILD